MALLAEDRPHLWVDLGTALSAIDSPRSFAPLRALLSDGRDYMQRRTAAYALGWLTLDGERAQVCSAALVATLANSAEHADVRAHAAEALANRHGCCGSGEEATASVEAARVALRAALADPTPDVRFWAAFALGQLRDTAALPALRQLAEHDTALLPGWWRVGEEAADAIVIIEGGTPPDRVPEPAGAVAA